MFETNAGSDKGIGQSDDNDDDMVNWTLQESLETIWSPTIMPILMDSDQFPSIGISF